MDIGNKGKRAQKEREERFLALININQQKLYRIAYSYVRNKDNALDIIQEAVYKGYISYHKVRKPEYEKTWITKIVINTAIDFLRKNKKVIAMDMSFIENRGDSGSDPINDKLVVEQALENLNERQKAVIILRFFEDMKLKEIADILDEPISTIKSLLYRALKIMKLDLREVNIDEQ
jgi:RNA polymerase sigma-70 factor (ECF subfamily)